MSPPGDATSGPTELERLIRSRRMVRTFTDQPIERNELDRLLDLARRAPSAGNTAAVEFLVLDTPDAVDRYWSTTMTPERQATFRWKGLLNAPALVVITTRPDAYVERYAEPDKARRGLGQTADAWAQPFWWIDAGMVAQNLLLLVTDRGWSACLFGLFDHEDAVRSEFDIPEDRRLVAAIAIGHPSPDDVPGRSAKRERRPADAVIHHQAWDRFR